MKEDTTIPFRNPALRDELSEVVREGRWIQDGHIPDLAVTLILT